MGFDTLKVWEMASFANIFTYNTNTLWIFLLNILEGPQAEGEKFVYNLKNSTSFPSEMVTG